MLTLTQFLGCFVLMLGACARTPQPSVRPQSKIALAHGKTHDKSSETAPTEDAVLPAPSFTAAAPRGFTKNDLGKPFTADFTRFQGAEGRTLLPTAGEPTRTPQGYMEHAFVIADSEQTLSAHASAWGIQIGGGTSAKSRYASYRAVQIKEVYEVDDTTTFRKAPARAVYYPWRVYMGHSYEIVLEGSTQSFTGDIRARLLSSSGDARKFATEHQLTQTTIGHGLQPTTGSAIFATTQEQIERSYRTVSEEPVVILVEWRGIPGRSVDVKPIEWKSLPSGCAGMRGCQACLEWTIDYMLWNIPPLNPAGDSWDTDGSPPDVVVLAGANHISDERQDYQFVWHIDPPIQIDAGKVLSVVGVDKDTIIDDDDEIGNHRVSIKHFHESWNGIYGKISFGNGSAYMLGECSRY